MKGVTHLLSDSAEWMTNSEFVDKNGNISNAIGETKIEIGREAISNESWVCINGQKVCNCYKISREDESRFNFECENTLLGKEVGEFKVEKNVVYSKFSVQNTKINGFEVVIKNDEDECYAYGSLFDGSELVNHWRSVMVKIY